MSRLRIRRLAPALITAVCALNLAACDGAASEAKLKARQAKLDPPHLWLAEIIGPNGTVSRNVQVCADQKLHDGFARAWRDREHWPETIKRRFADYQMNEVAAFVGRVPAAR